MDVTSTHIGSFFIVSFPEPVPRDDTLYFLQDNCIAGILLFADHCADQDKLREWLADFKKSLHSPLIVAVDQEGGRVCRFGRNFPALESPRWYGEGMRLPQYRADLARVCEELFETGVNLNLVPVVDLFDAGDGHVLDTRSFSDKPEVVARFAAETIAIHHDQGLMTCAKHFPGLGRTVGDPHEVLTTTELTEKDFWEVELPPFREAIAAGADAVMVTHLSAPKADEAPAVVSYKIMSGWLKENLSFPGAVITDDLLMEGASHVDASPRLAARSFEAGADLLLFGRDLKRTREMFDVFSDLWQAGRFTPDRIRDAIHRVEQFLKRVAI